MVTEFRDKGNRNARIKIDYSKKTPEVKFSYPDKENQTDGSMFSKIRLSCMRLNLILFSLSYLYFSIFHKINILSIFKGLSLFKNNSTIFIIFLISSVIILFNWILSIIIYLPFKKKWDNYYPKYMAKKVRKKITTLSKEDIKIDNGNYYVEIPYFSNVFLQYKATEDFSKYLKLFEIKEHNFRWYYKKKKRKRDREVNEDIWCARFYFSEKPLDGNIKVIFH
jgi:hypothetical protein